MQPCYLIPSGLALALFSSCASLPYDTKAYIAETKAKPAAKQINWPKEYEPSQAAFFVHNQIEIKAPPQVVWEKWFIPTKLHGLHEIFLIELKKKAEAKSKS
jgi:hypothetical protein